MNLRQLKKALLRLGFWCLVGILLFYAIFPFYYAILTSLKSSSALFEASYWITKADFSNYAAVLSQASFLQAIANSLVVSLCVVMLALFLGLTASYALGRVRFRGRGTVLMMVLGVSMF
ncbi:carbohydrate ABC transporter permease, partial [Pseudomonas syringae pv. actinidiae]|nr:carbohydrate ABC transporter permease [Pseudomonas syringae pv. actinidiae]